MAKLLEHRVQDTAQPASSAATPVQFLPSTMLSWRIPIMVSAGLGVTAGHKKRLPAVTPQGDHQTV